jgi:hypothetical protein
MVDPAIRIIPRLTFHPIDRLVGVVVNAVDNIHKLYLRTLIRVVALGSTRDVGMI